MWDEKTRERFRELRRKEDDAGLTPAEELELSCLIQQVEDEEAALLRPAADRLDREAKQIEARIHTLEELARRREALVARLQAVLAEVQKEDEAIDEELASLRGQSSIAVAARGN